MSDAAELGTKVHSLIERHVRGEMDMSHHTPGPWYRNTFTDPGTPPYDQGPLHQVYAALPDGRVSGVARIERNNTPEGQANARLIAVAPDLIRMLKVAVAVTRDRHARALEHGEEPPTIPDWVPEAEALIAKAEGRA